MYPKKTQHTNKMHRKKLGFIIMNSNSLCNILCDIYVNFSECTITSIFFLFDFSKILFFLYAWNSLFSFFVNYQNSFSQAQNYRRCIEYAHTESLTAILYANWLNNANGFVIEYFSANMGFFTIQVFENFRFFTFVVCHIKAFL